MKSHSFGYKYSLFGHSILILVILNFNKHVSTLPLDSSRSNTPLKNNSFLLNTVEADANIPPSRLAERTHNQSHYQLSGLSFSSTKPLSHNESNQNINVQILPSQNSFRARPRSPEPTSRLDSHEYPSGYANQRPSRLNEPSDHDAGRLIEGSGAGSPRIKSNHRLNHDANDDAEDDDDDDDDYDDYKDNVDNGSGSKKPNNSAIVTDAPARKPPELDIYNPFRPPVVPSKEQPDSTMGDDAIKPSTIDATFTNKPSVIVQPTTIPALVTEVASVPTSVTTSTPSSIPKAKLNMTKQDIDYDYEDENGDEDPEETSAFEDNDPLELDAHANKTADSIDKQLTSKGPISAGAPTPIGTNPNQKVNSSSKPTLDSKIQASQTTTSIPHVSIDPAQDTSRGNVKPSTNPPRDTETYISTTEDETEDEDEEVDDEEDDLVTVPSKSQINIGSQENSHSTVGLMSTSIKPIAQINPHLQPILLRPHSPSVTANPYDSTTKSFHNDRNHQAVTIGYHTTTIVPNLIEPYRHPESTTISEISGIKDQPESPTTTYTSRPAASSPAQNQSQKITYFSTTSAYPPSVFPIHSAYPTTRAPALKPTTFEPTTQFVIAKVVTDTPYHERAIEIAVDDGLTRQIYDKAVEVYQETEKTLKQAWDAVWPPNMNLESSALEPLLSQPMFFMFALAGAVIGLVLLMMLVVYVITYQIQPGEHDDISLY